MTKPSFRETLLIWLVLILTVWNVLRVSTALMWKDVLNEYSTHPAAIVTAISGMIWVVTGIFLVWSIWQKKAWTKKLLLGAAAGYSVWYWSERLVWQSPHPNWLFAVIVNLAIIIFILYTTKSLTREAHERKIENPTTE